MEVSRIRPNSLFVCDICKNNKANGLCNDCDEYMCQGCFKNHKIAKPCRSHVLTSFKTSKYTFEDEVLTTQKNIQELASDAVDDIEPPLTIREKQPSTGKKQPFTRKKQPSPGKKQPSPGKIQPSTGKKQSSNGKKQPSTWKKQTSTAKKKQSARKKQPYTGKKQPYTGKKQASTGKDQPYTYHIPRGFKEGKRVRHLYHPWKGTITNVNPEGYFTVKWDSGGIDLMRACKEYFLELL